MAKRSIIRWELRSLLVITLSVLLQRIILFVVKFLTNLFQDHNGFRVKKMLLDNIYGFLTQETRSVSLKFWLINTILFRLMVLYRLRHQQIRQMFFYHFNNQTPLLLIKVYPTPLLLMVLIITVTCLKLNHFQQSLFS